MSNEEKAFMSGNVELKTQNKDKQNEKQYRKDEQDRRHQIKL